MGKILIVQGSTGFKNKDDITIMMGDVDVKVDFENTLLGFWKEETWPWGGNENGD